MIVNILANRGNLSNNEKNMQFINEEVYKDRVGIYQIKNLINNKLYIGQTLDRFIERYWNHAWKLNNQRHDNKYLMTRLN